MARERNSILFLRYRSIHARSNYSLRHINLQYNRIDNHWCWKPLHQLDSMTSTRVYTRGTLKKYFSGAGYLCWHIFSWLKIVTSEQRSFMNEIRHGISPFPVSFSPSLFASVLIPAVFKLKASQHSWLWSRNNNGTRKCKKRESHEVVRNVIIISK